jgi:hypothetical protein
MPGSPSPGDDVKGETTDYADYTDFIKFVGFIETL